MDSISPLFAPNLSALQPIRHAFHTRSGGCSLNPLSFEPTDLDCGLFTTLDQDAARLNRNAVRSYMQADALLSLKQVHSNKVVLVESKPTATEPWNELQEADALVTKLPNIAIGAMTADCGPVLFADPNEKIIGAAHAGWQGAVGGVLQNTIATMEALGARRAQIHAALGPCIQQKSYEVGPEFYAQFIERNPENTKFFTPSTSKNRCDTHFMFDLAGYVTNLLKSLGLASVVSTGQDTCSDPERFFSHRRGTIKKKPETMRHISTISILES